ncbi:unnamed protein product [Orchesella dallaii]|uniref:Prolyl 4-hydroxylase alpha subunit domain-containing protein n=1 Tax=Orchesella dallaii TaxID=48710 RepID=A0ABP1Q807_9HEXA
MCGKATSFIFFEIFLILLCTHLGTTQNAITQGASSIGGILNTFHNLTRWANKEKELYETIKSLAESVGCWNTHHDAYLWTNANRFIEDFESSTLTHLRGIKNPNAFNKPGSVLSMKNYDTLVASNLVLVYRMTHRFENYGEFLQELVSNSLESENTNSTCNPKIQYLFEETWPGRYENDMAIIPLLSTYEVQDIFFNPPTFIQELSSETFSPANITAEMAYDISEMALVVSKYVQAFDWLNYARRMISQGDTSISKQLIDDTKEDAVHAHNMNKAQQEAKSQSFYVNQISLADMNTPKEFKNWTRSKEVEYDRHKGSIDANHSILNMWALCAKENLQSEKDKARLKCYLDRKKHPWLTINPLRVEVLADYPLEILLFHDVLGEELGYRIMERLDTLGKAVSKTGDVDDDEETLLSPQKYIWSQLHRSSASAWVEDLEFPKLKHISEIVTGLLASKEVGVSDYTSEAEAFQAVEYTVGRYYTQHKDVHSSQIETPELYKWTLAFGGIRTATLLYYLNDVERGGETVFTSAGVIAEARKGSAVFCFILFEIFVILLCTHLGTTQYDIIQRSSSRGGILNTFRNLTRWATKEKELYETIKSLTESVGCLNTHHDAYLWTNANRFINDFESSTLTHLRGIKDPNVFNKPGSVLSMKNYDTLVASNLVLVYRMTHRFESYGESLQELVSNSLESENANSTCNPKIQYLFEERWPGRYENDMAIIPLLSTYEVQDIFFNPPTFIQELSSETVTPANITAEMAYDISEIALVVSKYVQAFDWLNYARRMISQGDTSISRQLIDDTKEDAVHAHNMDKAQQEATSKSFYVNRISLPDMNTPKEFKNWTRSKEVEYDRHKGSTDATHSLLNMWALCAKKDNLQSEMDKARLKCYLDRKKHSWLTINPLRVEVLADYPLEILLFHDVLGEELGNRIMQRFDTLEKAASKIANVDDEEILSQQEFIWKQLHRSSASAWVQDLEFPKLKHISEIITGLLASTEVEMGDSTREPEMFQAVEYTVGRYYTDHTDAHPSQIETPELYNSTLENGGIRIGTLLYYLNDVERGGETVFTSAGVRAEARKGSAVFWYVIT